MTRAHSKIGASSASRWFACPGSVRLCEGIQQVESEYAREGTAAHALAAHCLENGYAAKRFVGWYASDLGELRQEMPPMYAAGEWIFVGDEMATAVQVYLDTVRDIATAKVTRELDVEVRFHLGQLHPDLFGTADCVVYDPDTGELWVLDYKHGAGVTVDPEDNPQLLYYAVGAALAKANRRVTQVHLAIVQPRAMGSDVKWWDVDAIDLLDFADRLANAAKATESETAPLCAGDHCKWCPAQPVPCLCSAIADMTETAPLDTVKGPRYDPQALADSLGKAKALKGWIEAVEDFALAELQHGKPVPGYKLVEKRGVRAWDDEDAAVRTLMGDGLAESDIYEPVKLKTPAALESQIGKKELAALVGDFVKSESSGLTFAPDSDKRPAVGRDLKADFEPVEG